MNTSKSRRGAAAGRGIARAALLLIPVALAACGSVLAGQAASPASQPGAQGAQSPDHAVPLTLCADLGAVNHLVVRRTGVLPKVHQRFTFPGIVTVTSAPAARAVATGLCALPRQPAGITNCPADFGLGYQLRFAAGSHHFSVVKIQATGCQIVSGTGKPRTIVHNPAFWAVLGKAMRLHGPFVHQAFVGINPGK
jgi:hypothetical protein